MSYCIRTDLAAEALDGNKKGIPEGAEIKSSRCDNISMEHLKIKNENAKKEIGKPIGNYLTLTVPFLGTSFFPSEKELTFLKNAFSSILPERIFSKEKEASSVLVAGIGNESITPDALGPLVCEKILATRHIGKELMEEIGLSSLLPVSVLKTSVLGQSGIDASELILAVSKKIKPSAVIVIDALCSRSTNRIGTTIQISDSGISPGSGVGGARPEISEKTLGVPVIAIGIPTVVDGVTIALDLLREKDILLKKAILSKKSENDTEKNLMVTPKDIDKIVKNGSELISLMINSSIQKNLSKDDISFLIS